MKMTIKFEVKLVSMKIHKLNVKITNKFEVGVPITIFKRKSKTKITFRN